MVVVGVPGRWHACQWGGGGRLQREGLEEVVDRHVIKRGESELLDIDHASFLRRRRRLTLAGVLVKRKSGLCACGLALCGGGVARLGGEDVGHLDVYLAQGEVIDVEIDGWSNCC